MPSVRRAAITVTLAFAMGAQQGCYAARQHPVSPLPVRLISPTGFRVVQPAGPTTAASTCRALRADVDLSTIRGDTLFFSRLQVTLPQPPEPPCAHAGAGYIDLAAHPELRSERMELAGDRTFLSILVAIPVVLTFLFVVAYLTDPV